MGQLRNFPAQASISIILPHPHLALVSIEDKMRAFIYLALFGSVALAANIHADCKPKCKDDCMVAASKDPADGQHCVMVLGSGPNGLGWYGLDEENSEHRST